MGKGDTEKKMSFDFNQGSTSATDCGFGSRGSASQNEFYWRIPEKHCGGETKCGKVCHKTMNCTIVDTYKDTAENTVYKYYCRKCKVNGEGSAEDCK